MRVSFALVLTGLTLILALLPAVLIWGVFSELMTSSLDLLQATTAVSTKGLSTTVQQMLLYESMQVLDMRLMEGESAMKSMLAFLSSSGLLALNLRPQFVNLKERILTKYADRDFITIKGHDYFSYVSLNGAFFPNNASVGPQLFWLMWQALNINYQAVLQNRSLVEQYARTLYISTLELLPGEQTLQMNISGVDQGTGRVTYPIGSAMYPSRAFALNKSVLQGWSSDLLFNTNNGQVELALWSWVPAQGDTWLQPTLSVSVQTISDELRDQLRETDEDRLFMFFRQPHGHLIAASHGKYYSESDVDRRSTNSHTNKLNVTALVRYTCLDSNDVLIYQSCAQLYGTYRSWPAIPALDSEMDLAGRRYWVEVGWSTSNLSFTVVMLKNRDAVMGSIDASQEHVRGDTENKKQATYIILAVVSFVGVVAPMSIGLWLGRRLVQLANGMDRIAKLDFDVEATPATLFHELHRFQTSFGKMERGLRAFGKFVPQAVVRVLIDGKMEADGRMTSQKLTIMFADIEGFSTICESISPERLTAVCTEYFEVICDIIIDHRGTIDKFIGDCIMAIWNAPYPVPGHEQKAVEAALAMQASVMDFHPLWCERGLPLLRFRLGLHTGPCLVGNFGCSHRVSYTCLGDSVNLSARLEALNKKFGTYLCVSHATYESCKDSFHFRRLAKVTVPGKSEVLPVYELLCGLGPQEEAVSPNGSLKVQDLPGVASPHGQETSSIGFPKSKSQTPRSTCMRVLEMDDNSKLVLWHWTFVGRGPLLDHAEAYQAAYEALVAGDVARAGHILHARPPLDVPDKAWAVCCTKSTVYPCPGPKNADSAFSIPWWVILVTWVIFATH
eukprot:EG_transcript_1846